MKKTPKKVVPSAVDHWKKLAVSLAIIIVLNVFFNVGVETFYPAPTYDEYCKPEPVPVETPVYVDAASCEEAGGVWLQPRDTSTEPYCNLSVGKDYYNLCYEAYNDVLQPYNQNAFLILVGLGVLTLLCAVIMELPLAVGNGLLYGGVLSVLIGTVRYWGYMDDYTRFIVSGVALLLLIVVGVRRLKD